MLERHPESRTDPLGGTCRLAYAYAAVQTEGCTPGGAAEANVKATLRRCVSQAGMSVGFLPLTHLIRPLRMITYVLYSPRGDNHCPAGVWSHPDCQARATHDSSTMRWSHLQCRSAIWQVLEDHALFDGMLSWSCLLERIHFDIDTLYESMLQDFSSAGRFLRRTAILYVTALFDPSLYIAGEAILVVFRILSDMCRPPASSA